MIKLNNIKKTFGEKIIISNFSVKIQEKEFVSIVGKSGSGKTTALNIMGLLEEPDEGDIEILGHHNPNEKVKLNLRRKHLGFIFQNFVLIDNETVEQNLLLSSVYKETFSKEQLPEALELVGLDLVI